MTTRSGSWQHAEKSGRETETTQEWFVKDRQLEPVRIMIAMCESVEAAELEELVEHSGYSVVGRVPNTGEAIALATECLPNLVLMDVSAGGAGSELDVAVEIQKRADCAVIYLIPHSEEAALRSTLDTRQSVYLVKPLAESHLLATLRLVLHNQRLEKRTKRAEELIGGLLDSISDGVSVVGPDNTIIRVNPTLERWHANSMPIVGKRCHDVFFCHRETGECGTHSTDLGEALKAGDGSRVTADDGTILWVQMHRYPIRAPDSGEVAGFVEYFCNITDRRRAKSEWENALLRIRRSERMEVLGALTRGIAHDVNNILGVINGSAEFCLARTDPGSKQHRALRRIMDVCSQGLHLTRQIQTFAHRSSEEATPIRCAQVVEEVLAFLQTTVPATVEIEAHIESQARILGDSNQLHRIVTNLCTNVIQEMPDGGRLTLELTEKDLNEVEASTEGLRPGLHVCLLVGGTNVERGPEYQSRLFDYVSAIEEAEGSANLALSVAQGLVKDCDGTIMVHSESGSGYAFKVLLPAIEEEKTSDEGKQSPRGDERILVIDDAPTHARLVADLLRSLGYQVTTLRDPEEALSRFRDAPHAFDLVITEFWMPDVRGDMLARRMLLIRPELPIILSCDAAHHIDEKIARCVGLQGVLEKPVRLENWAVTIRNVLDQSMKGVPSGETS